jgi:hypothetical protein
MTTTPTTEAPTPASWLGNYVTWFKAHEKLLIIAVGAFLIFHLYDRGVQAWEAHDQRLATAASQQVKTDDAASKQTQAQLTALLATVGRQQATIDKLMAQRATQTIKQKQTDARMTPSELATRFQGLLKVAPADVTSLEPSGNLVFTPVGAQANIDQLEDLRQCTADRADLKTELIGQEALVVKQTDALTGVQKELTDEKASHTADVKLEKAKNHHTALKWFKIGVIVGAVGTEAIRIWAGHP